MRMKENAAKLEEYKKKPRHKRDREDIRKRNNELVEGPREIEKLKKDFRMSFVIFIKDLSDYYKSLIEYNKNLIETKKKNKTFSEKSKELCLRYARVRVTNSLYSYYNYQVKVMFTEDARNYRKGFRDDWKVLRFNKESYIIQTGDGSEHCLTKMLRWLKPRDEDDDGDQEEPIPNSDMYDEKYFYRKVEMYADLGLTPGGAPGNYQADGSDEGSLESEGQGKKPMTFPNPLLSERELKKFKQPVPTIDQQWRIISFKESECEAGADELPEREDTDEKMKDTEARLEKVEEEKEVETSGPVKPKSKGNKIP